MTDGFLVFFGWIGQTLERPFSEFFSPDSTEYAVMNDLKNGWGKRNTAELLNELTAKYGDTAGRTVERFLELRISVDWAEIGKREAHEGTEIQDFVRVLWGPLRELGFEYTMMEEKDRTVFHVTKCPIHELTERTGMHDWVYRLACATDYHMPKAFSPAIEFSRSRTLIKGHECCDHTYRRVGDP